MTKRLAVGLVFMGGLFLGWGSAPGVARAGDDAVASALRGIRDELHEMRNNRERVDCTCKCER